MNRKNSPGREFPLLYSLSWATFTFKLVHSVRRKEIKHKKKLIWMTFGRRVVIIVAHVLTLSL